MGSIIVKTLQLLVKLLEWEHERLEDQRTKQLVKLNELNRCRDHAIDVTHESTERKIRELRQRREAIVSRIDKQCESDLNSVITKRLKIERKAEVDAKVITALNPIVK